MGNDYFELLTKNAHGIEGGSDRYCATVTELLEFSDPFSLVFAV